MITTSPEVKNAKQLKKKKPYKGVIHLVAKALLLTSLALAAR